MQVPQRKTSPTWFDVAGLCSLLWFVLFSVLLGACPGSAVAQRPAEKHVLLLFNDHTQDNDTYLDLLASSVRARIAARVTFFQDYVQFPESSEFGQQEYDAFLDSRAETLRRRYAGVTLDIVIAVAPPPLLFAVKYRDRIFPGVPVVFTQVGTRQFGDKTWPGITGVTVPVGLGETIDLALHLQPDTETVAVISAQDPFWVQATHAELLRYSGKVKETFLFGPPNYQLYQKVVALPPHTIVLFHLSPEPKGQPALAGMDLIDAVAARVPTYSAWSRLCLNHGCIGGAYENSTQETLRAAELASRILSGEKPDNIPVMHDSDVQVRVDWRALQRWHIPESALPKGSLVLFREPGLWERGRKYFLLGLSIILCQAVLIAALLWQQAQKRKTEAELRKSEEKFSKSFRHGPLAISIVRTSDGRYVDVNETFEERTGWRRDEVIGRTPLEIGLWSDPNQRSQFLKQVLIDGGIRNLEVRFRRKDGQPRTSLGSSELIEVSGESCILSVIADITDRKTAEEALATLSGRLIEAQEAERTRIARELHDDINQRLAMVAVTLKTLKQHVPASDLDASGYIEDACTKISDLEDDIQALSHRLHSSKLEYLGLKAAAESLCTEVSQRQNIEIDFRSDAMPEALSDQISLCLFRVLQEAIHNAVKYSGVRKFEVSLTTVSSEIQLRVHDSGAGFDTNANNGHGLGLTSMKERLKLVKGELFIDSRLQHGTTILARVPLDADLDAELTSSLETPGRAQRNSG
jgi:PAS domain S-box-containing protein